MVRPSHDHTPHAQTPTRDRARVIRRDQGARDARSQKGAVRQRRMAHVRPNRLGKRQTAAISTSELLLRMRRGNGGGRGWYAIAVFAAVLTIAVLAAVGELGTTNDAAAGALDSNLSIGSVAPPTVVGPLTHVSSRTFASVGGGGLANPIKALPPSQATPLRTRNGKPEILYIDTEYCPYCAAERWSVIVALSRFGSFSSLHVTKSTPYDVAPDTDTFTFHGSRYNSPYVDFVAVEFQDRNGKPLDAFTPVEQAIFEKYDAPPYVPTNLTKAIPFVSFANEYYAVNGGYDPRVLSGLSWRDIATVLNSPTDPVAQSVVGNANYITAAICQVTQNAPDHVCGAAPIRQIEQHLPPRQ